MSTKINVTILGATGETGLSIVNALLQTPEKFAITGLARPSSVEKASWIALKGRGVRVVAADLDAPVEELAKAIVGTDVLICCVLPTASDEQVALVNAAKQAGVKRFVPSFWGPAIPPRGKEQILDHIKGLYLPYTAIDVGWWYQLSLPRLPSGRIDHAVAIPLTAIPADGNVPIALTDKDDIGPFVARIIADPQTLNRMVFIHGETWTWNKVVDLVDEAAGEKWPRVYKSGEDILADVEKYKEIIAQDPKNLFTDAALHFFGGQYTYSWGVRGDNTLEHAEYLGYLDARKLYPEITVRKFEDYVHAVLEGEQTRVYPERNFG
ncbi:isoflavone reductase [Thozetella sp. PMI_491]|nr:isoflavone reductase [Thozetella sp. PMI_491]